MTALVDGGLVLEESARALLGALQGHGGVSTPGQLAEASGLAPQTVTKWLRRLRDVGLVDGPKPRPQLTHEGWAAAGGPRRAPGGETSLAEAIARWPSEQHRAFLRLGIAAVIARWHLGAQRPEGHPGFIAAGPTNTGKTSLAHFIADAFGLDWALARVLLRTAAPGELLGRLEREESAGYSFRPSALLAGPFIVVDEFDKADPALQRDALVLFQGDVRGAREGTVYDQRAVPLLTCNTPSGLRVPVEYRRRCVVLNTDPVIGLLEDLDERLHELAAAGGAPRLELERLRPPASEVPDSVRAVLRELLRQSLTPEGWRLCEVRSIELLVLGAATGDREDIDLAAVAVQTAVDYLTCAETVGETREDWRPAIGGLHELGAGAETIRARLARGQEEQQHIQARKQRPGAQHSVDTIELTGERHAFAEELRQTKLSVSRVPSRYAAGAAGARAQLERLRSDALNTRSAAALEQVRQQATGPIGQARAIRTSVDRDRDQREREAIEAQRRRQAERDRQRQQEASRREAIAAAAAARKAQARRERDERSAAVEELQQVRATASQLERLWKRHGVPRAGEESPGKVLAGTYVFGQPLFVFQVADRAALGRFLGAMGGSQGTWSTPLGDPALRLFGSRTGGPQGLAEWGESTRDVLRPPLLRLHELEDQLQLQARRKPRAGRPVLT